MRGALEKELSLIAKYAVTDDSSTLVTVRDEDEIAGRWTAHGYATRDFSSNRREACGQSFS